MQTHRLSSIVGQWTDAPGAPHVRSEREGGEFGYEELSGEEARDLIKNTPDLAIIDVRDEEKYNAAHVPGAKLIPLNNILADPEGTLPKRNILFVCNVGQMSGVASQMAVAMGCENVYNLADGTKGWIQSGFQVDSLK